MCVNVSKTVKICIKKSDAYQNNFWKNSGKGNAFRCGAVVVDGGIHAHTIR